MEGLVKEDIAILDVMALLDQLSVKTVYVLDAQERVVGSITDGDIRRYAIAHRSMEGSAKECMKTPCLTCTTKAEGMEKIAEYGITSIPLVSAEGHIKEIIYDHEVMSMPSLVEEAYRSIPVVMMAGGKGERLYPYTSVLPKPLIPIAGTPIAERILKRFDQAGLHNYILSLNYKKNIIKAYFDDVMEDCSFTYVEEEKPLGTGGSLSLMKDLLEEDFFVINCDILIDVDLNSLIAQHKREGNLVTVVSALKQIHIPYGVLETDNEGQIVEMKEKPSIEQFINTGMYLVNKKVFEYFPAKESFHMTDVVEELMKHHQRVGIYAVSDSAFMDMGIMSELDKMNQKLR